MSVISGMEFHSHQISADGGKAFKISTTLQGFSLHDPAVGPNEMECGIISMYLNTSRI